MSNASATESQKKRKKGAAKALRPTFRNVPSTCAQKRASTCHTAASGLVLADAPVCVFLIGICFHLLGEDSRCFMRDEGSEVAANNYVPARVPLLIEMLLDLFRRR